MSSSQLPNYRSTSPNKRARADTASNTVSHYPASNTRLILPILPRRVPPLKATESWMFKGLHPLYSRHLVPNQPTIMEIRCGQLSCTEFKPRVINRVLSGTNNWKVHYRKCYPKIATLEADYIAQVKKKDREQAGGNAPIFTKPLEEQSHSERFRILLLEFTIKNNLFFAIVD